MASVIAQSQAGQRQISGTGYSDVFEFIFIGQDVTTGQASIGGTVTFDLDDTNDTLRAKIRQGAEVAAQELGVTVDKVHADALIVV